MPMGIFKRVQGEREKERERGRERGRVDRRGIGRYRHTGKKDWQTCTWTYCHIRTDRQTYRQRY